MSRVVDGHLAEIVERDRVAEDDLQLGEVAEVSGARDAGRHERHSCLERDPRRTGAPACLVTLAQPLLPAGALGEHDDDVPRPAEADGGLDRLLIALAPPHRKRAAGTYERPERTGR